MISDPRSRVSTTRPDGASELNDLDPTDVRLTRPAPSELRTALAEVKGQIQFLLYLTDQLEDAVDQLGQEAELSQAAFLRKILAMYSSQLESRHQGLGERIAEVCQELYITVREFDS